MSIEIEVKIEICVWSSTQNDFKIYGCTPVNDQDIETYDLKFNQYNNLAINGILPKLEIGSKYNVRMVEKKHPKFGIGYEVESVFQNIPTSVDQQKAYLSTLLTETQIANIYEVYDDNEDIIQLMKDNTFNYDKVKGIGEHMYNIIRSKIIGNLELQEALVALSKYGLTYSIVSKLVKIYGSASLVVQKIQENPYILTEVDGIGFTKCDTYALSMGIDPLSPHRISACIFYTLNEEANGSGHSWLSKNGLIKKCTELMKINESHVANYISEYDGKQLYINEDKIAKTNLYNYEKWIFESVQRLLAIKPKPIADVDKIIEEVEKKQGFAFTDEQKDAIKLAVDNNLIVISGKAGVGKTTILKGIIEVLRHSEDFKNYYACALSGKASQRINESTGLEASTIHRLLCWRQDANGFSHNIDNPLPKGVCTLDEGSMVNSYLYNSLIGAINDGSKFIIIGDIEQLEPIGSGNVLKDLIESNVIPVAFLTQVHRQAMKSGILSTANQIREGIQFTKKGDYENRVIGELKDLHFKPYEKPASVKKAILIACKQYLKAPDFDIMNFQVIVPLKKRGEICTKKLNIELQEIFNPEMKPVIERNGYNFKEGDKVIQNGNNYDDDVFNGTLGIIKEVDTQKKEVIIDFVGTGSVKYNQEQMGQIDMAYALTVHKVQGSQFDNVVIGLDFSAYNLLSRQLVYTALTRASKLAILICENDALIHAIRTNKASKRNTFLKDMLIEGLTSDK